MPDFEIVNKSLKASWVKRLNEIVNKSLKASWVKRFLAPETQSWKTIPLSILQPDSGPLLFKCNFVLKALPDFPLLQQFCKDILSAWEEVVIYILPRQETMPYFDYFVRVLQPLVTI